MVVALAYAEFHADAAITGEAARLVEHGLSAHPEFLPRAIGIDTAEHEVQERLAGGDLLAQHVPLRLVPARVAGLARFPRERRHPDPEHFQHRTGNLGEGARVVLLPIPVGGELGQASIARLAFAQLGGSFPDGLLPARC